LGKFTFLKQSFMKKIIEKLTLVAICLFLILFIACKKEEEATVSPDTTTVPDVFKKIYGASNIYVEGSFIVIKSTGEPDHKSPYYPTTSTKYIKDDRVGFQQNPNSISTFSYTFKIPLNPAKTSNNRTLGAATIGVALNGTPFFNQYQMQGQAITPSSGEYISFDLYGGHPTPTNEYHYHIEPNYLTGLKGKSALMGFMLDGFPIYGPLENGKTLVSSDLDAYHGHTHATDDYPSGIYHYHITADAPYINGNGYYGTAGTWSK
jgi:hypothetical protein